MGGAVTYDGTTLVPQALSGTVTLPGSLTAGFHTLTVTEANQTPLAGTITASGTLTVPGPAWTAYVASNVAATVTPIDTATNTAGRPIALCCGPRAIAVTPDGKTAYVANGSSDNVTPIDTAS